MWHRDGGENSYADLNSIVRHIDEECPHLKAAFYYIALWNIKTGSFLTALVEAGYLGELHEFSEPTAQMIEALRQDAGEDYTFAGVSARMIEALKQDVVHLTVDKVNRTTDRRIWGEMEWEWRLLQS